MPIPHSPARVYTALALAVALCLWCFIQYQIAKSQANQSSPDPYMMRAQLTRYEGLRAALPQDAVIGYTSDLRPEDTRSTLLFLGSQYALAPRIVVDDDRREWVIGNFSVPADFAALGASRGLRLVRDFGNGVILYRRAQS